MSRHNNIERFDGGGSDPASPEARRRHNAFSSYFRVGRAGSMSEEQERAWIQSHSLLFWQTRHLLDPAYPSTEFTPAPAKVKTKTGKKRVRKS